MWGLEKYADALGEPGKGIHSYRIFGLAAVDLAGTAAIAGLITYGLGLSLPGFLLTMAALWGLGIGLHVVFGVKTPTSQVFLSRSRT